MGRSGRDFAQLTDDHLVRRSIRRQLVQEVDQSFHGRRADRTQCFDSSPAQKRTGRKEICYNRAQHRDCLPAVLCHCVNCDQTAPLCLFHNLALSKWPHLTKSNGADRFGFIQCVGVFQNGA